MNAVSPAMITTEIQRKFGHSLDVQAAVQREFEQKIPLGRFGVSEEVAQIALFLASPASSYVTGAEIAVDGGLSAA